MRRQLAPHLEGRRIVAVEILDPRWSEPAAPGEVADAVVEREVLEVGRRGKYFDVELAGEVHLVMHLRMTGNLLLVPPGDADARPYVRVRLALDDGSAVLFADPRRFGTGIVLLGDAARDEYFATRLGVEPLSPDFTADALRALAQGRRSPVKAFLLSQERIAGVGNIYADEALFRARLHPLSPAGSMRPEHLEALRDGIVAALEAGIDGGGASIDDFRDARGERGTMQDEFLVHTREGEPCPRCGETILRIVVSGRSTYYCPGCQVRLRRRPRRRRPASRST